MGAFKDISIPVYGPSLDSKPSNWEEDGENQWSAYYFADPMDCDPDFVTFVEQQENGLWKGWVDIDFINHNLRVCENLPSLEEAMEWCDSWYPTDEQWEEYRKTLA